MKFAVSTLRRAETDIVRTHAWLAEHSEQGAKRWYEAARSAIKSSGQDADQNGFAPESVEVNVPLRQKFFKTRRGRAYRVLYTILGKEVRVLRMRGSGQAPVAADDISN